MAEAALYLIIIMIIICGTLAVVAAHGCDLFNQNRVPLFTFVYVPLPTALEGPPNDGHGQPRAPRVASNSKNCTSSDFGDGVTRFMVVCD